jgi:hypothetical protein
VDTKAAPGQEDNQGKNQVHMTSETRTIILSAGVGGFAEDKDEARRIRVQQILPMLDENKRIILDFENVKFSTQSFVHAILGEVLKRYGEAALSRLEFRNCAPQVKSLIQLVVDYSLGGFATEHTPPSPDGSKRINRKKVKR